MVTFCRFDPQKNISFLKRKRANRNPGTTIRMTSPGFTVLKLSKLSLLSVVTAYTVQFANLKPSTEGTKQTVTPSETKTTDTHPHIATVNTGLFAYTVNENNSS